MFRYFSLFILLAAPLCSTTSAAAGLSLFDATQRVLAKNPQTALSNALEEAASGRVVQAGVLPNPELSYELEDFSGDTNRSASDATTTFSLSQQFSLPGKRSARQALAEGEQALAALDSQAQRLRLIRLTRERYIDAIAAQEKLAASEQNLQLARQTLDVVSARVSAGKVSPIEQSRATVALRSAQRELALQQQWRQLAQRRLAALWGEAKLAESLLDELVLPPTLSEIETTNSKTPTLKLADSRVQKEQAALRLAQAERVSDFTLMAGMKREAGSRAESLLVGVSIPIPLFNRNQGAVLSAKANIAAAEADQALVNQEWRIQRDQLETQRAASFQEAAYLRDDVLRLAREIAEATREGYQAGKFSLLDLLDAQRSLIESQSLYLAARLSFHQSDAALNELLGLAMSDGNTL